MVHDVSPTIVNLCYIYNSVFFCFFVFFGNSSERSGVFNINIYPKLTDGEFSDSCFSITHRMLPRVPIEKELSYQ